MTGLGWFSIARIGLVQAALGAIVVFITSTLNRVMVVEIGLAASVPGALVGIHYALQLLRPKWGHGADAASRRTPWIVGGMAVLAIGGALAAVATAWMAASFFAGLALAILAFICVGIGVGASGTALLTLLADATAPERRGPASAMVWIMMIVGFIATTAIASPFLAPFSFARLIEVGCAVSVVAFVVATLAILGVEPPRLVHEARDRPPFRTALAQVWADDEARGFAIFIFVSMLAYSAQDLILEPFAGLVFNLPVAQTTAITSLQNSGVLAGMIAAGLLGRWLPEGWMLRLAAIGCLLSACALALIASAGLTDAAPLLRPAIASLGFSNGLFAVAAVGVMMALAAHGDDAGVKMGVLGAAQAVAMGAGGFLGTVAVDLAHRLLGDVGPAYSSVFLAEGALFVISAGMLMRRQARAAPQLMPAE